MQVYIRWCGHPAVPGAVETGVIDVVAMVPATVAASLAVAPGLLCDGDGIIVEANGAAVELAGAAGLDALVGTALAELLSGDAPWLRLRRADGTEVPVRVGSWQLPGSGTRAVMLVDVSEMVTATEALRDEQRRLYEVQRVARMGSWEHDCGTGETVWSPSHYEMLGIEVGSRPAGLETMLAFTHPDDRDRLARLLHHRCGKAPVSAQVESLDAEFRVIRADGELRRVYGVAEVHPATGGRAPRVTGYSRDVTEAWQVHQELAAERGRLLEAQRIANIGSWSLDVVTGTVHRSDVLLEFYEANGVAPDDDIMCNVHRDDRQAAIRVREQLLRGDTDGPIELELRSERGGRIYVTRSRAERSADGALLRLHGTVQDVTAQRVLERQLAHDRRRLEDAQLAARLGTWEWDPASGECAWSEMLYELAGVDPGTAVSFGWLLRSVHRDDRRWLDDHFARAAREGTPVDCEFRARRADRSLRVFRCRGARVTDPDGHVSIVGTAQDVTEQRATESRMRRSSQRFADLVSVAPVGIGLFDESERLVDANDALCDLLGHHLEQLRGRPAASLTGAGGGRLFSPNTGERQEQQRTLLRADGFEVHCDLHITVSVRDDGQKFWLVVFSDITEQRRVAEMLRHQATHDELTGLPNRAAVNEMLGELLAGGAPELAVLFCDIDNFKRVNDSLGHDAGDELLVALARRLEGGLPAACTVARLSGDEFVVICPDLTAAGGVGALARTVSGLLRNAVPVRGQLVRVSASVGVAVADAAAVSGADLLRFADAAMFQAKRRGTGRVSVANAALIASADRQVVLEGELRDALTSDGLRLHFQPVVGADGRVLSAEALVRWPHPERGLLGPADFLPIAEQGDLLRELDRWVLRTALRQAVEWPAAGDEPVAVAVNLAGLLPGDPGFVDVIADAVAEAGIGYERVVLELVETSLVDLPSRGRSAMAALSERGVRFAVDDFGTGYSSLARLKNLPAQIIKVDRSFVAGVGTDPSDFAVARAVVDMARAMGRTCVAEGVETPTQFTVLRGVGVDAYQGWLFSRALPQDEFRAILTRGTLPVP